MQKLAYTANSVSVVLISSFYMPFRHLHVINLPSQHNAMFESQTNYNVVTQTAGQSLLWNLKCKVILPHVKTK